MTAADITAGQIDNTATADSDQTGPVTDDVSIPVQTPVLEIVKLAPLNADEDGSGDVSVGDTLTYTITATNGGGSNLTNVVVTDDLITPTGGTTPCALVAPAGTCTLIGIHVVTAGEVAIGIVTNAATADSDQTPAVTDTVAVPAPIPAVEIVKPAPTNGDEDGSGDVSVGDTLTYTITATNIGGANLTNVVVTDDLITPTGGTAPCALGRPRWYVHADRHPRGHGGRRDRGPDREHGDRRNGPDPRRLGDPHDSGSRTGPRCRQGDPVQR